MDAQPFNPDPPAPPGNDADAPESALPSRRRLAGVVLILCAFLFITAGAASQLMNIAFGLWFSEVFVFLGTAWVLTRMSGRRPGAYARLMPLPSAPTVLFGASLGFVNYFAAVIPLETLAVRFSPEVFKRVAPDTTRIFLNQTRGELVLLMLAVAVAAPVCEEFVFRGVLQQGLFPRSRATAIVVTAALFSAFHVDPVGFWARLELGILFGWLFFRTGSLWPGICAHAANNLTASGLYFLFKDAKETAADPPLFQVLLLALGGAGVLVGLFVLARRFPALLRQSPSPHNLTVAPPTSLYPLAWPWILGALLALGALFAVDRRGVELNWFDLREGIALPGQTSSSPQLMELRRKARAGEISIEAYEARARRPHTAPLGTP